MKYFENFFLWMLGLFLPTFALAQAPSRMGNGMLDGMMSGMGIMAIFMMIVWILLIVLLVLGILALIKYLREK